MKPVEIFFGDAKHSFVLTAPLVRELEQKCGAVGALCSRVFLRQFTQSDIHETIRLSLIGGGTAPKRAAEIIATYALDRPIVETYPIATKILERLWFGVPHEATNAPS